MESNFVKYVKEHVEKDIEMNRDTGIDYSGTLGAALCSYLHIAKSGNSEAAMDSAGMKLFEFGLRCEGAPTFLETSKCSRAVHEMTERGNADGLAELRRYAIELIGAGNRKVDDAPGGI